MAGWDFPSPVQAEDINLAQLGGSAVASKTLFAGGSTQLSGSPQEWSITNTPAANTQATVTRAANGSFLHVARSIVGDFIAGIVAPAASNVTLVLRDGATGVGAILWSRILALQAVAGDKDDTQAGVINISGTAGNAMTLEFTAAGGANTLEGVSLTGYDST